MKTQSLPLDLIRIDADTQSRITLNHDVVDDYADVLRELPPTEWPFPPLDVFHDGTEYFLADGFHRDLGAIRANRASAPCVVHKGTAKDARIFAMTANDRHGLRLSRADKRACVEWLLDNGGKMPQKEIAEKAGVSERLVKTVVSERNPSSIAGTVKPPKQEGKGQSAPSTTTGGGSRPPAPNQKQPKDLGKCPNCMGTKWSEDEDGVSCAKCHHPHGEPAGDVDEERVRIQRLKTVKTAEALMRAFDDLQDMRAKSQAAHEAVIDECKRLMKTAREWK
jgi:hypothetical protein